MIIIRTCTNDIGAIPPNLCVMVLSAAFFLLSGKTFVRIRKGKVLATKFSDTPSVGGAYKQENFMCRSSKYSSSHLYEKNNPLYEKNNPLSRLGVTPLSM